MVGPSIRRFVRQHLLWIGFLTVLVPLVLLVSLQYGWLVKLEKASAIAEKASLNNYLKAVSNSVEHFYYKQAVNSLNIPDDLFRYKKASKIEYYFKKKNVDGAKSLFVVWYTRDNFGKLMTYDPATQSIDRPADDAVERAIQVALAPWRTLAQEDALLQSHALTVDERDPQNRIILNPITEDECRLVGVAGMIVDEDYFKDEVLPDEPRGIS